MLTCLPIASMDHNWLHTVIYDELLASLTALQNGTAPVGWPEWLPVALRPMLQSKWGLRDHVQALRNALATLSPPDLSACRSAVIAQNDFPTVLQAGQACTKLDALPIAVRGPAMALFEYAFRQLTELETRDRHYDVVHAALHRGVCPFCGLHTLDSPGALREDLDHYLQISRYPFCGANLRNLSPMCSRCNKSYKKNLDVIWDDEYAISTRASDPYLGPTISVTLLDSLPFAGETRGGIVLPKWEINFVGSAEESHTWNRVFKISERYPRDVLNPEFRFWIDSFGKWAARRLGRSPTIAELAIAMDQYADISAFEGFSDRAFLKVEVFRMLRNTLNKPDLADQLSGWLIGQIERHLDAVPIAA